MVVTVWHGNEERLCNTQPNDSFEKRAGETF